MDSVMSLSRSLRRRTLELERETREGDLRVHCRVPHEADKGMSRNDAAREVGCVRSTVWCIVRRFELAIVVLVRFTNHRLQVR
jgi:hypothetical protein